MNSERLWALALAGVLVVLAAPGCGPKGAGSIDLAEGGPGQLHANPGRFAPAPSPSKSKAGRPRTRTARGGR